MIGKVNVNDLANMLSDKRNENIELKQENEKLKDQIKEANYVICNINNKSVGKEYGLDSEDLWGLSKEYLTKYKVQ